MSSVSVPKFNGGWALILASTFGGFNAWRSDRVIIRNSTYDVNK